VAGRLAMAGGTGLGLDIKVLLKTPRSVLTGEEDERIRDQGAGRAKNRI